MGGWRGTQGWSQGPRGAGGAAEPLAAPQLPSRSIPSIPRDHHCILLRSSGHGASSPPGPSPSSCNVSQRGDAGGAVPPLPTRRLPLSPWLALPVTAVTLLPSSQLPPRGDGIPMSLAELQARGWPLLAEQHDGQPWGQGTRCARGGSCPQQGAETPPACDSQRGGTQTCHQRVQRPCPLAGPQQQCSAVAGDMSLGTQLRPPPSPWVPPRASTTPARAAPGRWGWDPPTLSVPPAEVKQSPNPPKVPGLLPHRRLSRGGWLQCGFGWVSAVLAL